MATIEERAQELDFKGVMLALIISALGFVAALFWRDAIQEAIDRLVPPGEGLAYSFGVAIVVTAIAVIVIYLANRYMKTSIFRQTFTKENIQSIDNRLVGRDITIRKRSRK